jgi:hypothetical protein
MPWVLGRLLLVGGDVGEDLRLCALGDVEQVDVFELDRDDGLVLPPELGGPAGSRSWSRIGGEDQKMSATTMMIRISAPMLSVTLRPIIILRS